MKPPSLSTLVLDTSAEGSIVPLGDTELEVIDIGEDDRVTAECDFALLVLASLDAFPDSLSVRVHSSDGFGTFLFHEAEILKGDNGELVADYMCVQPNKYWEGTWGLATFLDAIGNQIPFTAYAHGSGSINML